MLCFTVSKIIKKEQPYYDLIPAEKRMALLLTNGIFNETERRSKIS